MYESSTQRLSRYEEEIRRLKLRQPPQAAGAPFTQDHTFIVGGAWDATIYIPPLIVWANPDGAAPEAKAIVATDARTGSGTITSVTWVIWTPVDTEPASGTALTLPRDLSTSTRTFIRPIVDGSGTNLSVGLAIRCYPGASTYPV